jgi:hypothetical protein
VTDEQVLEEAPPRRKYPWAMLVVAVLFVVVAFLSWYGTWFGRTLTDAQAEKYLDHASRPRDTQHALAQIAARIMDGDASVKKFYPAVVSAASHDSPEVRMTAAWAMGQDNTEDQFHTALLQLLGDPSAGVRHNAALALARFNDPAARPELVAMLTSRTLRPESAGTVELIIKEEGIAVAQNSPLLRIKKDDGSHDEIRSEEASRVEAVAVPDGARVESGDAVMVLAPSTEQAWEALRALFILGQPDDIPSIERYARQVPGMPDRVQQQAVETIKAIRSRASKGSSITSKSQTDS